MGTGVYRLAVSLITLILAKVYGYTNTSVLFREGETVSVGIAVLKGIPELGQRIFDILGGSSGLSDFAVLRGRTVRLSRSTPSSVAIILALEDWVAMEESETFQLQLEPQDTLRENEFVAGPLSLTIVDSTTIAVYFEEEDYSAREQDGYVTVTVARDNSTTLERELNIQIISLTYSEAQESGLVPSCTSASLASSADISQLPHMITFAPGDTFTSVRIAITDDDINELNEVFVLKLDAISQTLVDFFKREVAYCKIIDDDELIVGFERGSYTFNESEGHITNLSLVKFNNRVTEQNITVRVKAFLTGDGLELGNDVNFGPDVINSREFVYYTFSAEEQSLAVPFSINDDIIPEGPETLILATYIHGLHTSCSISDGCHRVAEIKIIDNDELQIGFEVTEIEVLEGQGTQVLCVNVTQPDHVPIDVTFDLKVHSMPETAGTTDFSVSHDIFRQFGQDLRWQCMEVSITDDAEVEATESFTLRLLQPLGSELTNVHLSPQDVTVRILDDDIAITFEKPEYIILEDAGSLQACVLVNGTFSQPLLLTLYTVQDTATAPRDYNQKELDVEIHSGRELKQCVNVTIVNNIVPDSLRQFYLGVSTAGHDVPVIPAVVTIVDDDIDRGCTFEVLNSSISEEEDRIEVIKEISEVLTSIGIPVAIPNITTLLSPLVGLGGGKRVGDEGGSEMEESASGNETVSDEVPDEQPPLKAVYKAIADEFEVEASDEGYGHFVEAVNQVTEAKEAACEGEGSVSSADVPRLVREYRTLRENATQNVVRLREVFGKMLCIKERSHEESRRKRQSDCPEICTCPPGGLFDESIHCVCEFFACMDPTNDLKPILGLFDVFVEEGLPCLALVVDTTGSMRDEIEAAKHVIHNFLNSEEHEPGCYVLLPFNDLSNDVFIPASIGEPTIASTYNEGSSVEELQNFITATDAMTANGGLDCPERQLQALLKTLAVRDPEGYSVMVPGSHIVMLTDAPSHDTEIETEVIRRANEQKVCISFFLSMRGGCINNGGRMMYGRISNSTGGTVTESISQDGFRYFDATHGSTQCADFYGIPLLGGRRKRQAPERSSRGTHDTEMRCHSFTTSRFTTNVRVTAHTSQPAIIVTKPNGESVSVPSLYGSSGPVFGESSPPSGEWSVCVDTGTLIMTLEKNDVMDTILKYLRPTVNSTKFLTTSTPPPACTTGQISIKTSRIADIASANIQLLSEGSGDVLVTAPLYGCIDLLLANITFPRAEVKYRIIGNDVNGYPFTISLARSTTFEAEEFRVETEGENPLEIEPHQNISIPVTIHNLNSKYVQYVFTYEEVTGFRQLFHPSNQLVIAPGASGFINLIGVATTAEPGTSYTFRANVTDGCSSHSVSKMIIVRLPATTTPPPAADECGCQNGGTCNIRMIRGRVIRRCLCPAEWSGPRCTIYTPLKK